MKVDNDYTCKQYRSSNETLMSNPTLREPPTELDLIRGIRQGGIPEHRALSYINNDQGFKSSLLTFLRRNNGGQEDLLPVFNEALMALCIKVRSLTEEKAAAFGLWGYLYQTCRFIWYKELNQRKSRWNMLTTLFENMKRIFDKTNNLISQSDQEKLEKIEELIDKIEEPTRSVLLMRDMGIPYKEIVQRLGLSNENHARQILYRGKDQLMKKVDQEFPDSLL